MTLGQHVAERFTSDFVTVASLDLLLDVEAEIVAEMRSRLDMVEDFEPVCADTDALLLDVRDSEAEVESDVFGEPGVQRAPPPPGAQLQTAFPHLRPGFGPQVLCSTVSGA